MIDKKDILKMAKHVFKKGQGYPDRRLMHPHREWFVGVVLFMIVFCLGGVLSVQMYNTYNNVDVLIPKTEVEIITYDEATVQQALDIFRKRAERYNTLKERQVILDIIPEASTTTQTVDDVAAELIAE